MDQSCRWRLDLSSAHQYRELESDSGTDSRVIRWARRAVQPHHQGERYREPDPFRYRPGGPGSEQPEHSVVQLDPNVPFTAAAPYTLGNASIYYSDFRNPPFLSENISVVKDFMFTESIRLQYRADAFNAFNRTDFGGINGTVGNPNFGRPAEFRSVHVTSPWAFG